MPGNTKSLLIEGPRSLPLRRNRAVRGSMWYAATCMTIARRSRTRSRDHACKPVASFSKRRVAKTLPYRRASKMIVRALIQAYRAAETSQRSEDARHAHWWINRMGDTELNELNTADVLSCLDRLASHGRSPSTVAFYLRFFRRVCAW